MEPTMTKQFTSSLTSSACKRRTAPARLKSAATSAKPVRISVSFANARPAGIPIRFHHLAAVAGVLFLLVGRLHGQGLPGFSQGASREAQTPQVPLVVLPKSPEEIDSSIARIET